METISNELFNLINPDSGDTQDKDFDDNTEEQDNDLEGEGNEYEEEDGSVIEGFGDEEDDDTAANDGEDQESYEPEEIEDIQSQLAQNEGFESWEEMVSILEDYKNGVFDYQEQEQEIDYDPEIIRLKELKESGIDIFEASAIMQADYNDLSNPKDILLQHFILENPFLSNEEAEELFEDEFAKLYDEEDNISVLKMKSAAKKAAKDLIQFQNYLREPVTKIEDLRKNVKSISRNRGEVEVNISKEAVDTYTKEANDFLKNKIVSFKIDEKQGFNYQINKEVLQEAFDRPVDFVNKKLQGYVKDLQSGKVDFEGLGKIMMMISDPDTFVKNIVNYGKALGKEQILRGLKNPSEKSTNNEIAYKQKEPVSDEMAKIIGLTKATR